MTQKQASLQYQTLQIHGGYEKDNTLARGIAIHPTAAFHFNSCEHAAGLFDLSQPGNIYTRLNNPTNAAFEQRVAALYGAVGAVSAASGMAAITLTVAALASEGQNIVVSPLLYGGTYNLFRTTLRHLGIDCRIADSPSVADMERLIDGQTRLVYAESMGNPTCEVVDLEGLAAMAHRHTVPFVVDNTFGACGYLCNPLQWGADIIVESATKWINGHGTAMGGIVVDGGTFDWTVRCSTGNQADQPKYPQIDGPSEGYHGLNLAATFGPAAFAVRIRVDMLRDLGCCQSPFDSYLNLIGLETLSLRVEHQLELTRRLAEYCRASRYVKRVSYVGFADHPSHALACRYFKQGGSAVLNVELQGDLSTTVRFVESLRLCAHMVMVGDSITVVTHPASTTHKQLSDADLAAAGVTPTLLRISAGLEAADDIIADFEQTFETAFNTTGSL